MDMIAIYLSALDNTHKIVANVTPDQFDNDTPCENWSVRRLLNHLIGGVMGFASAAAGTGKVDPGGDPPDILARYEDDPSKAFEDAKAQAAAAWNAGVLDQTLNAGGGMPGTMALRIALIEAVVHGWDIAKATGQDTTIDPMLAQPMLDGVKKAFGSADRGGFFGPEVPVGEDAPAGDQLVAYLGRTP